MNRKSDIAIYYSHRGHPLLYVGPLPAKPTITLENYSKWYGVEMVNTDGTVSHVDPAILDEVAKQHPTALMGDHNFQPHFLYRLADRLGAVVDSVTIDVAGARWLQEQDDIERFFFPPR